MWIQEFPYEHDGAILRILQKAQEVDDEFLLFFEGRDVSLAKSHSLLLLIRMTIRIQLFLTELIYQDEIMAM